MRLGGDEVCMAYGKDLAYVHDAGFRAFAEGSAPGLLATLRQAGIRGGRVVDLGCGSGIWAGHLVSAGYDVTGVDISAAMIALARRRAPKATFHVASLWRFKLPRCAAVTALGEVFNYCFDQRSGPDRLAHLFARVFAALDEKGLFIFDVAEPGRNREAPGGLWEGEGWTTRVKFDHDPASHCLTRHIVTYRRHGKGCRRREETHRLRLYRGRDIATLLRAVGFRVRIVRGYGAYRLPRAWVGLIARKPPGKQSASRRRAMR